MTWRTALPLLVAAGLALAACASTPDAPAEPDPPASETSADWRGDAARAAGRAADVAGDAAAATWQATRTAGTHLGIAAKGVVKGFERPERDANYGPYPRGYAEEVKKHFERVLRTPDDASFRISRPVRGYMNHGLLRGGGVAWRGWLVDVEVSRAVRFGEGERTQQYVVRMRDGEVIDVHKGAEHSFLRRAQPPASAR